MRLGNTIALATAIFCLPCTAPAAEKTYSVQKGDGLDAIARHHHTSRATLLRLNPLVVPDNLAIGDVIQVPATSSPRPLHKRSVRSTSHRPTAAQTASHTTIRPPAKPAVNAKPVVRLTEVAAPPVVKVTAPAPIARAAAKQLPAAKAAPVAATKSFLDDYKEPTKNDNETPIGRVIVDLIWKLALVLGIAYLSIYALRGIMNRQAVLPGQRGRLKVLETAALGPNRSVHLVRVGNKVLVLGSTPDQITAIGEVDEPETAPQSLASTQQAFAGRLAEAVAGEKGGALPEEFHGGIRHLWDRVQEIRGLRSGKGPTA
jgi:flagellar biosynthetic protein FliO